MQFCSCRQGRVWNVRRTLVCSLRRTAYTEDGPGAATRLNAEPRAVATGSLPRHSTNNPLVHFVEVLPLLNHPDLTATRLNAEPRAVATGSLPRHSTNNPLVQRL